LRAPEAESRPACGVGHRPGRYPREASVRCDVQPARAPVPPAFGAGERLLGRLRSGARRSCICTARGCVPSDSILFVGLPYQSARCAFGQSWSQVSSARFDPSSPLVALRTLTATMSGIPCRRARGCRRKLRGRSQTGPTTGDR
jgi:hypothetical protein